MYRIGIVTVTLLVLVFVSELRAEELYKATLLTRTGEFTSGIEGPAADDQGNVYAVNFGKQGTIGLVDGKGIGKSVHTLSLIHI